LFQNNFKTYKDYNEGELIKLYRKTGNTYYVGELYKRYTHLITVLTLKYLEDSIEAENAVMDIFEIMVLDLERHEIRNFSAWLYNVTKNHCLKKKQKQMASNVDNDMVHVVPMEKDGKKPQIRKESRYEELKRAIKKLDVQQQQCIKLFYLENKSYEQIEENTGFNQKQVKNYIQNGKRKLKSFLLENADH